MYVYYDLNIADVFRKIFIIKKKIQASVYIRGGNKWLGIGQISPGFRSGYEEGFEKTSLKKANFRIQRSLKIVSWKSVMAAGGKKILWGM